MGRQSKDARKYQDVTLRNTATKGRAQLHTRLNSSFVDTCRVRTLWITIICLYTDSVKHANSKQKKRCLHKNKINKNVEYASVERLDSIRNHPDHIPCHSPLYYFIVGKLINIRYCIKVHRAR